MRPPGRRGAAGFTAGWPKRWRSCAARSPGERLVAELIEDTVGSAGGSATVLAYQWRKAGDSERAVDYLLMAAEQAGADHWERRQLPSTTRRSS